MPCRRGDVILRVRLIERLVVRQGAVMILLIHVPNSGLCAHGHGGVASRLLCKAASSSQPPHTREYPFLSGAACTLCHVQTNAATHRQLQHAHVAAIVPLRAAMWQRIFDPHTMLEGTLRNRRLELAEYGSCRQRPASPRAQRNVHIQASSPVWAGQDRNTAGG